MTLAQLLTPDEVQAVVLSLRVSVVAVAIMLGPGIVLGWVLARLRFPGRLLLDALIHLPLVLPPVVVGYVLLIALGPNSVLGRFIEHTIGIELAFTWKAAAIASAVISFPLLVRPIRLAIEAGGSPAGSGSANIGRRPAAHVVHGDDSAGGAGNSNGHGSGVCAQSWRIRRDNIVRGQHARHTHAAAGCFYVYANSWRRRAGYATGHRLRIHRDGCADRQ